MSPKTPVRPKIPNSSNDSPPGARDTAPDVVPWRPIDTPGHEFGQTQGHRLSEGAQPPAVHPPAIAITDLPPDTHISRITIDLPISNYYLAPRVVDRLPEPDRQTGLRSIVSGRKYVDLVDGGTVPLGTDAEGHFRAKLMTELIPSGPRLERVGETLIWRWIQPDSISTGDSELMISRRRLPADEPSQPGPFKRPRLVIDDSATPPAPRIPDSDAEPWTNWGIAPQRSAPEDVTIAGVLYKTVPRSGAPDDPIVYIKNPAHLSYDFDLMQRTLSLDRANQPRGAIQVPPDHHWEIDPTLPFERSLTDYVATYFPELADVSLLNVARNQFSLANGSSIATGIGLTTLRQVFNDWKTTSITPRPELADPLLMLPITPTSPSHGNTRTVALPALSDSSTLRRLEFDPRKFQDKWDYFILSQSASDFKRFMESLLVRNGYVVFKPTSAPSYPALVFRRAGHDFVFYMSLHRVRGNNIHVPSASDRKLSPDRLLQQIGRPAIQAVENAQTANKLIWLRGGSRVSAHHPDAVFIVRIEAPSV